MYIYQHTQRSRILLIIIIFVLLFMLFLMYRFGFHRIGTVVFILMVFALYLFNSLVVKVNSDKIHVAFGSGLIRKNIPFTSIKSAEKVRNKLVVVLGPTACGKTKIGVNLAKKFNGEIISADSRQVYKGMDIGTGKITKKEMQGIPHHLLDVASPKRRFTVAQYQKKQMM